MSSETGQENGNESDKKEHVATIQIVYNILSGHFTVSGNVKDEILMEGMLAVARNMLKDNYQMERLSSLKYKAENAVIPIKIQ